MKFKISRTSGLFANKQPCIEATKMSFEKWHTRTCTEQEFNKKFSKREGLWRDKGKNHRTLENGYITRQGCNENDWGIEFNNFDEFLIFVKKHMPLVIQSDYNANHENNLPIEIEIYDDYRE